MKFSTILRHRIVLFGNSKLFDMHNSISSTIETQCVFIITIKIIHLSTLKLTFSVILYKTTFFIISASGSDNLFILEICQFTKLKLNGLILRVNNKNKMYI